MEKLNNNMIYIHKINFIHRFLLIFVALVSLALTSVLAPAYGADKTPNTATAIGGDFELTDQNGNRVKSESFRGKHMLVFFGFTHCPEVCPTTISTLSKAMTELGGKADQVTPVFISVDPKRDTPKVIKDYLMNFDKRIVGLTGTVQDVKKAADAYKVYFAINKDSKTGEEDYQVDHSTIIYLMDKTGAYVRHFSYNTPVQDIVAGLQEAMK